MVNLIKMVSLQTKVRDKSIADNISITDLWGTES